eukprot:TRINITY_DN30586_c0_g1_i1.p2 TRINITY_DN30586_c0_g1~~TRINITY_DN30586_c0_g1_i1.p2  ORF type:complete len:206 (-),score=46.20 TRINITY_DN30586_c0_g1_i1:145-762(-)
MRCQKSEISQLANAAFQALIAFGDKNLVDRLEKEGGDEKEEDDHLPWKQNDSNYKQTNIDENDINSVMNELKAGDLKIQALVANNLVMTQQLVSMLKTEDQTQQKSALQALSGVLSRGIIKYRIVEPLMNEGIINILTSIMQKNLKENKKESFQYAAWSAYCLNALQSTDASTKAKVAVQLKEEESESMGLVAELSTHTSNQFFD